MDLSSKIPHLITLTRDLSVAAVKETLKNITRKAIFSLQLFKGACLASEKKEKKIAIRKGTLEGKLEKLRYEKCLLKTEIKHLHYDVK